MIAAGVVLRFGPYQYIDPKHFGGGAGGFHWINDLRCQEFRVSGPYLIVIDLDYPDLSEVIWHELIHLHIQRVVGCRVSVNDPAPHQLIDRWGIEQSQRPPVPFFELVTLCQNYALKPCLND